MSVPADVDETMSLFPAATADNGCELKLSGADLVAVRGSLDSVDKLLPVVLSSASVVGVSVVLEKLLSQLSWPSTTSVCELEDPDSGVSV